MPLKAEKKTVIEVDYGDLERFVKETYKQKEYSFVAAQECGNDSSHSFSIPRRNFWTSTTRRSWTSSRRPGNTDSSIARSSKTS